MTFFLRLAAFTSLLTSVQTFTNSARALLSVQGRRFCMNANLGRAFPDKSSTFVVPDRDDDDDDDPDPQAEWKALEESANENRAEFEAMLKAKLEEWKEMKAAGILDKLDNAEVDDEVIEEMDTMSKRLLRRRRGERKEAAKVGLTTSVNSIDEENIAKAKIQRELVEKLNVAGSAKSGSSLACFSLLNEMKDKGVLQTELVESLLLSMTRLDSAQQAFSAIKSYLKWIKEGIIVPSTPKFATIFANACFSSGAEGLAEAGTKTKDLLIAEGMAKEEDFLPGLVCAAIYKIPPPAYGNKAVVGIKGRLLNRKLAGKPVTPQNKQPVNTSTATTDLVRVEALRMVQLLKDNLKAYSVPEVNPVIRALGRRRLTEEVFSFLDSIKAAGHVPDEESLEFLTNAMVASVVEQTKSKAMRDLPASDASMPEIVFTGRSNVGKSSLVNYLVNRKTLASTSPTPGHTTQFHFFAVNKDRADLPSFYLVDVPGLGYAEAAENTQDSWRSLLERYLSVRDHLAAVFHLIDSRHKVTPTDRQLIEIASRAAKSRKAEGKSPFLYTIVLTKTDKAAVKGLRQTEKDVRECAAEMSESLRVQGEAEESGRSRIEAMGYGDIPVLKTSSTERVGREDLWRLLHAVLTAKRLENP